MLIKYWTERHPYLFSFITLCICASYFYFCNYFFPMMSDDYAISFIWDGAHGGNIAGIQPGHVWERIDSLSDIFLSLKSMYMTWGGRMESWFIAQLFLYLGKPLFNICNTIVFCFFFILAARISLGNYFLKNGWYIFWNFSGLWLVNYAFFNTTVWISGAANYLWLMVFQLLFFLPYVENIRDSSWDFLRDGGYAVNGVIFLSGLLAGNTNENSAGAVILAAAWIWYKSRRRWMLYGLLGISLGYAALIFAPGNYARYQVVMTAGEGDYLPLATRLVVFVWLLLKEWPLVFLLTPYLHKDVRQKCQKASLQKEYHLVLLFTAMGVLSALAMLAAPMIPPRSFFGTSVFLLIAGTMSIRLMAAGKIHHYRPFIARTACTLLAVFTLYTAGASLYGEILLANGYKKMAAHCLANTGKDVVICWQNFSVRNREVLLSQRFIINHDIFGNFIGHIRPKSDQWMNQAVAAYYHLRSIRLEISEQKSTFGES